MFRLGGVRLRAALASALVTGLLLSLTGGWLRTRLFAEHLATEEARMRLFASQLVTWAPASSHWFQTREHAGLLVFAMSGDGTLRVFDPALGPYLANGAQIRLPGEARALVLEAPGKPDLLAECVRDLPRHALVLLGFGPMDRVSLSADDTICLTGNPERAAAAMSGVDTLLLAGVPAVTLLAGLLGWLVTGLALRPVEAIRRKLEVITTHNLSQRVPQPGGRDEMTRLAQTVNDTLGRLEHAVAQQRYFIAAASHELRTPITSLRATLEVSAAYPDRSEWAEVLADATAETLRLERLADDLLAVARLEARPALRREPVDLAELARDLTEDTSTRVTASGRAVVAGERRLLERALRNLLDNAHRHATSTVHVAVSAHADTVRVEVTDDGPGIPPGERERVFEPFTRLDDARDRERGGAGLGLAIVRDIVTLHGGTVTVAGEPGCTLTVLLPRAGR